MFGSVILDVAIGMVLVYLLLSLIATAAQETLARWINKRAQYLEHGLTELLGDPGLVADIYQHPMIASLYRGTYVEAKKANQLPSYIPARNFSAAFLDLALRGRDINSAADAGPNAAKLDATTLRKTVARLQNTRAQRLLLTTLDLSNNDLAAARLAIENWFDASMDRVSGWYKRTTQAQLLRIGFGIAVLANVNSLRVAQRFYVDPGLRQAAVALAGEVANDSNAVKAGKADVAVTRLERLDLPIGWTSASFAATAFADWQHASLTVAELIFGWLLTALAISLGAPFWFDLLNRFMVIRSTVKPKEKSGPEKSKDPAANTAGSVATAAPNTPAPGPPSPSGVPAVNAQYQPHEWAKGYSQGGIL